MRKNLFLLLSIAAIAHAQGQFPDCANNCITNGDKGDCAANDFNCLCHRQGFLSSFQTCVTLGCLLSGDVGNALQALQNQCQQTGVSTSLTSVSTSSTATTGSSSTTGTSTTSSGSSSGSSEASSSSDPTTSTGGKTTITKDGQTMTATVGPSNTPSNTPGSSNVPLGPIIGGVVGGIAAIALLMIAFWLCRRGSRRRRARRMQAEDRPDLLEGEQGPDMHETQQRNHAGIYAPSEASYPASNSSGTTSTAPLNLAGRGAPPVPAVPSKEEYRLRDEVDKLKREVERLQAQSANPQLSVTEMKQLQSQAVRNLYGEAPPSYVDTIGHHLND